MGSGGGVQGTSTSGIAFVLIPSSNKGTEALLLSFFIATLVPTVIEYHSSELSDFGLSGLCREMGDIVDEATIFRGDVKEHTTIKSFDDMTFLLVIENCQ